MTRQDGHTDAQSIQLILAQRLMDPLAQLASSKIMDTVAGSNSTCNYHFTTCLIEVKRSHNDVI